MSTPAIPPLIREVCGHLAEHPRVTGCTLNLFRNGAQGYTVRATLALGESTAPRRQVRLFGTVKDILPGVDTDAVAARTAGSGATLAAWGVPAGGVQDEVSIYWVLDKP